MNQTLQQSSLSSATPAARTSSDDSRVRFLRACDRCRVRKIKNPCSKCVAAGATCSFSASVGTSRTVLSSSEPTGADQASDRTNALPNSNKRKVREVMSPQDEVPPHKRKVLDHESTAHFYMSSHGLSHHAGSTSGLPLLEATRRLLAASSPSVPSKDQRSEPDWNWLQDLLQEGSRSAPNREYTTTGEDSEYFPGRSLAPSTSDDQLLRTVSDIIPPDLMSDLLRVFFNTIHPVWPILHIPSFFADLYRWNSHSFAALVVSMCMLASRYVDDPRVRSDAANPASAGLGYYDLFCRLLDHAIHSDNVIYAIQSRFFGSMFHSVDNVPHPVAQGLVADALSRTLDGGLHRSVSPAALGSAVLREVRSVVSLCATVQPVVLIIQRTAWAVYAWDKQISAFCGRPPTSTLWDYDVRLPEPFDEVDFVADHDFHSDGIHVANFRELIQLSAILEHAFLASVHRPIIANSSFLTELSRRLRPELDDADKLDNVMASLTSWRRALSPDLTQPSPQQRATCPSYSVATEQICATDHMVQLMVISRQLQLETLSSEPQRDKLEAYRTALLKQARDMTALVVQLGATYHLGKLVAYRLLFTGRLLLACVLSARSDGNRPQVDEATKILHATSVVLRHFVSLFPVALGAAEVLDETIRVCRVLPAQSSPRSGTHPGNHYAWYRPIVHHDSKAATSMETTVPLDNLGRVYNPPSQGITPDLALESALGVTDLSPFDAAFAFGGVPMPNLDQAEGDNGERDFLWLLPGGDGSLPYYLPPSV